jgi:transposase
MDYYAGIDVSLESSSLCVVDATGRVVREAKIASEPEALTAWLKNLGLEIVRIGLEAGPLSQWLYSGMKPVGLPIELLETRHVRTAFKIMPVKTDRKDARGITQLMRLGWFRPVASVLLPHEEYRTGRLGLTGEVRPVVVIELNCVCRSFHASSSNSAFASSRSLVSKPSVNQP